MHSRECIVKDTHICTEALYLLYIPQGEGVVVAEGNQNAVLVNRRQIILGEVASRILLRAVMVVPVLTSHQHRHTEHTNHKHHRHNHLIQFLLLQKAGQPIGQCHHTQANPNGKETE